MKKIILYLLLLPVSFWGTAQNLNLGLHAHYPFNGNLNDQSLNGYNLTPATGSVTYATVQGTDMALVLNGNSSITTQHIFNNSAFTQAAVSVWFKATGITGQLQIIVQGAALGFGVYIAPNTGRLMGFFDGSSAGAYQSQNPVTDGQWHHVVTQNDGYTTYMYLDGVLNGSSADPFTTGNGGTDNRLYLGKSNQNAYPYSGLVNELRIYDRMLTPCEIAELYARGVNNPVAHYPYDGSLTDISGHGYSMTVLQGAPSYGPFMTNPNSALVLNGNTVLHSEPINNSAYNQSALSVWFKTADVSTAASYKVVVQGAFLGFGLFLESSSGKLLAFMDGSIANGYLSSMPLIDGEWHHVVLQSDGRTTRLYVDGVFDGQIQEPLYTGNGGTDNRIYVGKTNQFSYPFEGSLNDLRFYDHQISDCEIKQLYDDYKSSMAIAEALPGQETVRVYPNPTDGTVWLNLGEGAAETDIQVSDITGKRMVQTRSAESVKTLDISALPSGVYVIRIRRGTETFTRRIIKQ